ncbi:ubiquitin thioesterase OTU1 [Acyrthosiphon pisum]|uniref:Ubiquitin thioesterase OTU n=1 Tax=Acyrthosiphon pisum TaxID=7029 RepID=C4WW63_ACYPI|nr:ubiquitin thioesterase OTU1 [Acyrthosiphon pisum]BAH72133.1 ACYPI008281 [Acyrthosiphon pisum]|eukprot:NP_001155750.1 ubiquitin thioesterase OTU1 [Acyrthosiphon pisum]
MSDVVLRLKCRSGTFPMTIPLNCPISSLKEQVSVLTEIPVASIKLLFGFPPKSIHKIEGTIQDAGLKSGDTIIAEVDSSSASVQQLRVQTESNTLKHVTDQEVGDEVPLILRKVVPADNSCLFTSMGFVLGGKIDLSSGNYMREIIANAVKDNQTDFSEAVLGKPNEDYCEWIRNPNSWGGAIEVSILSNFYGIEIAVIDTQSGSISKFGEDKNYPHRVFLIYDGIHYDPLYLESPFSPGEIQTLFPTNDDRMLDAAQMLANEAKSSRQYTDVNRFTLKCLDCGCIMIGQTQAQEHAKLTAHNNFNEY